MTQIETVMTGIPLAEEVMTWITGLENGTVMTETMARGKHFYFNCDGRNHYVYEVDESRREIKRNGKQGRKKRAYVGVMSNARRNCPTEAEQWERKHACHDQSEAGHDTGGNGESVGTLAGYSVFVARE